MHFLNFETANMPSSSPLWALQIFYSEDNIRTLQVALGSSHHFRRIVWYLLKNISDWLSCFLEIQSFRNFENERVLNMQDSVTRGYATRPLQRPHYKQRIFGFACCWTLPDFPKRCCHAQARLVRSVFGVWPSWGFMGYESTYIKYLLILSFVFHILIFHVTQFLADWCDIADIYCWFTGNGGVSLRRKSTSYALVRELVCEPWHCHYEGCTCLK